MVRIISGELYEKDVNWFNFYSCCYDYTYL